MLCPKCKAQIDSDSFFCDQCGAELYICPNCKTFCKGKRCTQCGTELVKASAFSASAASNQPSAVSCQPAPQTAPQFAPQPAQQPAPQSVPQTAPQFAPQPAQQYIPQPTPQPNTAPYVQPAAPAPQAGPDKTVRPGFIGPQQQVEPGHLVCSYPQRIRLGLASGVIIGRNGHYPQVFASFSDVSRNHARIDRIGVEWKLTDLGSSYGTFLNGQQLQPQVSYNIHVGDTIRFSSLEFKVEG